MQLAAAAKPIKGPQRPSRGVVRALRKQTAALERALGWRAVLAGLASTLLVSACALAAGLTAFGSAPARPWIIAHRGASGTLPEHTLQAYALAIEQARTALRVLQDA